MTGEPVRVGLAAHITELRDSIRTGRAVPTGRLYGLPELPHGGYWMDIAGVAATTGTAPKTISGWLARSGPLRNPFPAPHRILYRLYWTRSDIESWLTREAAASDHR